MPILRRSARLQETRRLAFTAPIVET